MKEGNLKYLIEKYYRGETSIEEEKALRERLNNEPSNEWEDDRMIFSMFSQVENESSPQLDTNFMNSRLQAGNMTERQGREVRLLWTSAIAAVISLLIGLTAGFFLASGNKRSELAALRNDIQEIKEMTILTKLKDESASQRILAVYEVQQVDQADDETIGALINVLNIDDNVNVRIAAADALFRFGNRDIVRKAFIQALSHEDDPNLQIRLINMLVSLNETRAIPKLQEMMNNRDQLQIVRETAASGIGQLL